jgi:hypothetical protein
MYYVRNTSNSLMFDNNQNRSSSQLNLKTSKKMYMPNKSSSRKNEYPNTHKPYFSKLDVDIKKISNGLCMKKQYLKTENFDDLSKIDNKIRKELIEELPNEMKAVKTSSNFFKTSANLPQVDENKTTKNNVYLNTEHHIPKERNIHTSQGFSLKNYNTHYVNELQANYHNRAENIKKCKELKEKMRESDPFFLKKKTDQIQDKYLKEKENYLNASKMNFYNSDIFQMKPFDLATDKTVDKFIIANSNIRFYGSSNPSKSEWSPKNSKLNLVNHTSVPYCIFNPGLKSFVKTKEEITKEYSNSPAKKQKSLGEFADLVRVFSPNPNKEYLSALQLSNNAFHKNSNICANYQNLHRMYGSLCDKPFVKKMI